VGLGKALWVEQEKVVGERVDRLVLYLCHFRIEFFGDFNATRLHACPQKNWVISEGLRQLSMCKPLCVVATFNVRFSHSFAVLAMF